MTIAEIFRKNDRLTYASLIRLGDKMLNKLTRFFSGAEKSPAIAQAPQSDHSAAAQAGAAKLSATPQESVPPGKISLLKRCDQKLAKWSSFFSGEDDASPNVTSASAGTEAGDAASMPQPSPPEELEIPAITQEPQLDAEPAEVQADAREIPESPQAPAAAPRPDIPAIEPIAEPVHRGGVTSDVQLQILEHLLEREIMLERQINKINVAVTGLSDVFRDELQRQSAASAHSCEQQLLDSKNTLEITLKSAFKKMADRQTALEDNYNQHIDLMQQVLESNQESIADAVAKLDNLAEQTRRLTENVLQLTKNIEERQSKINIDALAERVAALEKASKRKSWFGK
jgi:uncharacterized phage infection (PIP) family protein YhgE